MNKDFKRLVDSMEPSFRQLLKMEPVRAGALPRGMPKSGIYLFTERGKHLYVGRTNRLRARINEHGRDSSGHNSAPFAFRLARMATGRRNASYRQHGSRNHLEQDPKFHDAFLKAKRRVRRMDVRFVEEGDQARQALLEMYVTVALHTPYNDFGTH